MFIHYRSPAFILKKENRGEADQLFTIFTRDFGKIEILGRAIRKISSKLRSGTELFYLSEIEFIQGKIQKTLTDAVLIDSFSGIRNDLKKIRTVYKISEIFDNLVKGQEEDQLVWELLEETFNNLNLRKSEVVYYYFLWNFLAFLGYEPELRKCALCGEKLKPEKIHFDISFGGAICRACHNKDEKLKEKSKETTPETIKILRVILERNLPFLLKLKMEKQYFNELKLISENICEESRLF